MMSKIKETAFRPHAVVVLRVWVAHGGLGAQKGTSHIKHNCPAACADPESFARGGPTLTQFF